MPTENEIRVLQLLSATDYEPDFEPGKAIESWGLEAVTVACEASLGSYPGLDQKIRTNAVASLGEMSNQQALETTHLLVKDPDPDVSIRALRAAGSQRNEQVVGDLRALLQRRDLPNLIAVEVVKGLLAIDSPAARDVLAEYAAARPEDLPHRANPLVAQYLRASGHTRSEPG
jgi:HEAT repeat protein